MPADVRQSPTHTHRLNTVEVVPTRRTGGFVVIHPKHTAAFHAKGLCTAEDFLTLPGEVVSGHPDRHVVQVEVPGHERPRTAFLKLQHYVRRSERWRNALAGFGSLSKSVREALILRRLEELKIDAPEWLAFGESADGRAFVLVADASPFVELKTLLSNPRTSPLDRRRCAENVGRYLAELHAAGIDHPDTTAKHCYVHPTTLAIRFIDWQRAQLKPDVVRFPARAFGGLHASLASELVSTAERLRVLWAYRRVLRLSVMGVNLPRPSTMAAAIETSARSQWDRRSIREQRLPRAAAPRQRLVWLAGESVCVVPDVLDVWPRPVDGPPFHDTDLTANRLTQYWLTLADGRRCRLISRQTTAPLARLFAAIRGRSWRSPELDLARILFHLERHEVPAPRLLAFGQRASTHCHASSFVLYEPPAGSIPLKDWLAATRGPGKRERILQTAGLLIRQLHDAGCRISGPFDDQPVIHVTLDRPLSPVVLGSIGSLKLVRTVTPRDRERDLHVLLDIPLSFLDEQQRRTFLLGYHGEERDVA